MMLYLQGMLLISGGQSKLMFVRIKRTLLLLRKFTPFPFYSGPWILSFLPPHSPQLITFLFVFLLLQFFPSF